MSLLSALRVLSACFSPVACNSKMQWLIFVKPIFKNFQFKTLNTRTCLAGKMEKQCIRRCFLCIEWDKFWCTTKPVYSRPRWLYCSRPLWLMVVPIYSNCYNWCRACVVQERVQSSSWPAESVNSSVRERSTSCSHRHQSPGRHLRRGPRCCRPAQRCRLDLSQEVSFISLYLNFLNSTVVIAFCIFRRFINADQGRIQKRAEQGPTAPGRHRGNSVPQTSTPITWSPEYAPANNSFKCISIGWQTLV